MVAGGCWWWPMQAGLGPAPAPPASPAFHVACHKTHLLPRGMTVREHQLHLLSTWHATRLIFLPRGHTPHYLFIQYAHCLDAVGLLASLDLASEYAPRKQLLSDLNKN